MYACDGPDAVMDGPCDSPDAKGTRNKDRPLLKPLSYNKYCD